MKFENTEVWGFESAIKLLRATDGMEKSDSGWKGFCTEDNEWVSEGCTYDACLQFCEKIREFFVGENDLKLMQQSRKCLQHIHVSVDIALPLYWWKHFEKIGHCCNVRTVQKLESTPITTECFEMDDFIGNCEHDSLPSSFFKDCWDEIIIQLERLRKIYLKSKDDHYLKELLRLLPQSWLETRTMTMTYDDILSMIQNNESIIIEWAKSLPYSEELLFIENNEVVE